MLERNVTLLTGDERLFDGKLTSLGGGATLEFLAGDELPGVAALVDK